MGLGLIKALKSPIVLSFVGLTVLYWVLAYLTEFENWIVFMNAILLLVAISVLIAYFKPICYAVATGKIDRIDYLIMGVVLSWLSTILNRLWSTIYRSTGQPSWMFESDVLGYFIWMAIIGGILHLAAPGAIDGKVPTKNWIRVGVAVSGGIGLAMVLLWLRFSGEAPTTR